MSNAPSAYFKHASEAQTCARCTDLGLPDFGIQPGHDYVIFESSTKAFACCVDCFDRLVEEIESLENEAYD